MPSYGQTVTLQYVAWDTVNNIGKTGDVANHTLRWVKDGTPAVPTNGAAEVDATNAPGIYKVVMTGTEASCQVGTLCGKSSSTGIAILPITITFENLPTALPGATNGLPQIGVAPLTNLDATVSSRSTYAGGAVASVTAGVTVTTNNDKTGYSFNLAQAVPTSNTAQTVGDALNAARAVGFGNWTLNVGAKTLTLYAADGTTVVRTFMLDSATAPLTRT
jgi:hypothetical protein